MTTVSETAESRALTKDTWEFECIILDAADDTAALLALNSLAPASHGNLKRDNYRLEPQGGDVWRGSMTYKLRGREEEYGSSYSFDTSGGTQHITQALEHVGDYGDQNLKFDGAINATKDDTVEGMDVVVPQFRWTETHNIPIKKLSQTYQVALMKATSCVNGDPWRGMAAGEILFLGASGSIEGEEIAPVTYHFAASPNAVNVKIGPNITIPALKGWEYSWVTTREVPKTTGTSRSPKRLTSNGSTARRRSPT